MPTGARALLAAVVGQAFLPACGEVFKFESRPIPVPYSLQGLAVFTVYSAGDNPAPGGKEPFVEYRNIQAYCMDAGMPDPSPYKSLQVALMSVSDYKTFLRSPVCDSHNRLYEPSWANMTLQTVPFMKPEEVGRQVHKASKWTHINFDATGTYVLLMTNCGTLSHCLVDGEVAVRNPFGYLSGTDYHKMSSYVWIFVAHAALAAAWAAVCFRWRSEFITVHGIIAFVLFLGLVESGGWARYLSTVNNTGEASESTMFILVMLTVLTTYASYCFIIVISQGWRMTEEVLNDSMLIRMGAFGLLWVVVSYLHESAMAHRQSYYLSFKIMLITTFGTVIVNYMVFSWIFLSLASLSRALRERKLDDQLSMISSFTCALAIAGVAGNFIGIVQIMDNFGVISVSWKYQFLVDGGLARVIFIAMLAKSMWLWNPAAGSARLFKYVQPLEQGEEQDGLWREDSDDAGGGGGNIVAPETVGAADEDAEDAADAEDARRT